MELVTEMLFLPEQFSFIGYVFAVNFHRFSVLTQSMPSKCIKKINKL